MIIDTGIDNGAKLLCHNFFQISNDVPVKSRHPGENRFPVFCKHIKLLDTGFRRYDDLVEFGTFYECVSNSLPNNNNQGIDVKRWHGSGMELRHDSLL